MRRLHQKIFYIQLDEKCVNIKELPAFDFEYLTPVIQCFLKKEWKSWRLERFFTVDFFRTEVRYVYGQLYLYDG